MSELTAEQAVRAKFPHAFIDSYWPDGAQVFVIYESRYTLATKGFGRTQELAWADAAKRLTESKEQEK